MRLERRLQAFNDTRGALLDEMADLDPGALVAKPLAGKWSMLEIIEHLVLAERAVFRELPDPSRLVGNERGLGHRVRYLLVMFILSSGIRRAIFEHPVAGPLSVEQAVQMGQVHVDGHVRQIRALQRLLG